MCLFLKAIYLAKNVSSSDKKRDMSDLGNDM